VIKARAPGSIMLMGEHAVLFGHRAIACAVDKYIEVELRPRADNLVVIDSVLAQYRSTLEELDSEPALSFVLVAIKSVRACCDSGFELKISAGFSSTVGLGSSAAVSAAVMAVLLRFTGQSAGKREIFQKALAVVHEVQGGRGSGTDLAASVYGGLIGYSIEPRQVQPLPVPNDQLPHLSLHYCGYKMKTPDVLAYVEQRSAESPELFRSIYQLMHQTSVAAEQAILAADFVQLGRLMDIYQGLMEALGVNDATLSGMIWSLRQQTGVQAAKISGSGLGDCVLALGDAQPLTGFEKIEFAISTTGVEFDGN